MEEKILFYNSTKMTKYLEMYLVWKKDKSIFLDKNSKHHKMLIIHELMYKFNSMKLFIPKQLS